MILSYIDPKFCNVTSLQTDLGAFSRDFAVFIRKDQKVSNVKKSLKIEDKTVQTILLDFGLEVKYLNVTRCESKLNKIVKRYDQSNLDYWWNREIKNLDVMSMDEYNDKNAKFYNAVNNKLYGESTRDIKSNVHILSDGSFEMLNPRCTKCGSFDVRKEDFRTTKPKVEYHGTMELRMRRYFCKKCGVKFKTKIVSIKDDNQRFSKDFGEKIRESYANRGGSLDAIAYDVKNFINIDISHQEVKNILGFDFEQIEYYEEPVKDEKIKSDYKSMKYENKDKLYAIRGKNIEISGYLVVDELFCYVGGVRWFCVSFHDISKRNTPFAVGLVKSRTYENMKRLYEIATRGLSVVSITTDHFSVYESLSDEMGIVHQQCTFHHFKAINEDVYPTLKDKTISDIVRMGTAHDLTDYRNIYRTYDEDESEMRFETFLEKGESLDQGFIKNHESIIESYLRHTQFTRNNLIPGTSNQAETFHSIPVVRQLKNTAKTPKGFMQCMAVIIQYYKPKTRKKITP